MGIKPDPLPDRAVVVQPTDLISPDWYRWLFRLWGLVGNATQQVGSTLSLQKQNANLDAQPLPLPSLAGGTYRVSVYARVAQPAATSSSLVVSISWTDHGIVMTTPSPPITGNAITTTLSFTLVVNVDESTAITYATTYASVPAGAMQYDLSIFVEAI